MKMRSFITALKKRKIDGVSGVRAFKGFRFDGGSNDILEIKFNGKYMPLFEPVFKDRKELNKVVKEIKDAWVEEV